MLECLMIDLKSPYLPLFIPTMNQKNEHGSSRDCFTLNPKANSPAQKEMFEFLGLLMGFAARTSSALDLQLAPVIWKRLLKHPTGIDDLRDFDQYTW